MNRILLIESTKRIESINALIHQYTSHSNCRMDDSSFNNQLGDDDDDDDVSLVLVVDEFEDIPSC